MPHRLSVCYCVRLTRLIYVDWILLSSFKGTKDRKEKEKEKKKKKEKKTLSEINFLANLSEINFLANPSEINFLATLRVPFMGTAVLVSDNHSCRYYWLEGVVCAVCVCVNYCEQGDPVILPKRKMELSITILTMIG